MMLNIFHSGGLWVIPFALLAAAGYSFYRTYIQNKSGYHRMDINPDSPTYGKWLESEGKFYHLGSFYFGCGFLLAAIVTFLAIAADYQGV